MTPLPIKQFSVQRLTVIISVVVGVAGIVAWAAKSPLTETPDVNLSVTAQDEDLTAAVARVDRYFEGRWLNSGLKPAEAADELTILRRLSLALLGTVPSLEEIRQFEADEHPDRLSRWTARMLSDVRFADYFAVRLGRSFVGAEEGQFVIFRRDTFTQWLSDQLRANRPYDQIVREMISQDGVWTDKPAANYVTATFANGTIDVNKLTGRTARAFLGQRIDCAQCHDHPFDQWKQAQFEGLAAYYGQTRISVVGVTDDEKMNFKIQDRMTLEEKEIAPQVPFHPEWLPAKGTRRERLAGWVTHPENRRFERAIVNRVWGLLFGKPWHDPVDSVPNPPEEGDPDLLDIIGKDFREHNCDLNRLIRVITASRPYRLSSVYVDGDSLPEEPIEEDDMDTAALEEAMLENQEILESEWGLFPLTRLRPEQVIGSMLQAGNVKTIDQNSHLFTRITRFFREQNFVREYGDLGENELDERSGTIPQALLRMNGQITSETTKATPFSSVGRIAAMASSDERCVEICYLVCLTRRPSIEESNHFQSQLRGLTGDNRSVIVEDLIWTLFNAPEFSWNH